MKKVLFATTALVAFAGAAAAEVSISGSAEMGIIGGDRTTAGLDMDTQYWSDVDVKFTMTGESDAGISFGAVVDLDEAGNLGNALRNQGTSMFIKGAFGTLTLGDTDGALDWALTDAGNIGNPGSMTDDETTHAGYNGDYGDGGGRLNIPYDNQILRYDYSFGDFGFAVSYEQDGFFAGNVLSGLSWDGIWAVGVKYALDLGGTTVDLGAGFQTIDFGAGVPSEDILGLGATAAFGGGFQAGVTFAQYSDIAGVTGADADHIGVGVGYESGPVALHVNYGSWDHNAVATAAFGEGPTGWGVAAAYDFGGGLSLNLGVGNDDFGAGIPDATYWSLGMMMSF